MRLLSQPAEGNNSKLVQKPLAQERAAEEKGRTKVDLSAATAKAAQGAQRLSLCSKI